MNLYLRLLLTVIWELINSRRSLSHPGESRFRVMPHDIDAFGHMNNGRYLQIMDVARAGWMARAGVIGAMWDNRWTASLGGGAIRFRRILKPFQSYEVTTRLLCFDEHWFYLEHGFFNTKGETVAVGISRAALRSSSGWALSKDVMDAIEPGLISAPVPGYLKALNMAEIQMFDACEAYRQSTAPMQSVCEQAMPIAETLK